MFLNATMVGKSAKSAKMAISLLRSRRSVQVPDKSNADQLFATYR